MLGKAYSISYITLTIITALAVFAFQAIGQICQVFFTTFLDFYFWTT
jgi:hypothetical protein